MKKVLLALCMVALIAPSCKKKHHNKAAGYFEAEEITVASEADGVLLEFNVNEGDQIKVGQSVGAVDSTVLYLNKLQLVQNMKSLQSNRPDVDVQIKALKVQLESQLKERDRIERLVKADALPAKNLDDINAGIKTLQSQIHAQQSLLHGNVKSLNAQEEALDIQIALIQDRIDKCRLEARVAGVVLAKYAHAGEFTATGHPLYKVADITEMTLRAYVTSDMLANIKIGDEVKVSAIFGNNVREYTGRVATVAAKSEFTPKNIPTADERAEMVYAVKILVPNDGYIKIGTYGEVEF